MAVIVPSPAAQAFTAVALVLTALLLAARWAWLAQRGVGVRVRLAPEPRIDSPPGWFTDAVNRSGLGVSAASAWSASRWAAILLGIGLGWWSPMAVAGLATAVLVGRYVHSRSTQRSVRRQQPEHLAAVIDVVLFRLAAGNSLTTALEVAAASGPLADDLKLVTSGVQRGLAVQAALDRWADTDTGTDVRLLADSVALAGATGGSQQAALLGVQATLRERDALAREVRALATQARTSAVVLVVAPVAFAGFVAAIDPRVAGFFATPAGWLCLAVGAALDTAGGVWMHRLAAAVQ